MTQPPNTQLLADALGTFRATRSAYQSTSDQALTQLLISLSEELLALREQPQASIASAPPADVAAFQAQLDALQATCEAQRSELAQLRSLILQPKPTAPLRLPTPRRAPIVSPPRVMRPIEYWEQRVPDYGDTTTEADLAALRSRVRVRPEEVVLTDEDLRRQGRRTRFQPPLSKPIAIITLALFVVLGLLYLLINFVLWLF
jgi:hypothetical protein